MRRMAHPEERLMMLQGRCPCSAAERYWELTSSLSLN